MFPDALNQGTDGLDSKFQALMTHGLPYQLPTTTMEPIHPQVWNTVSHGPCDTKSFDLIQTEDFQKNTKKKLLRSLTHLRPLKDFCSGKSQKDPVTVVRFPSIISQGRALLIFWVVMVRPFNPGSPNNGKANPVGTSATLGTSWCGEKNAQKLMLLQMHRCFFGFHSQNFSW